MARGHSRAVLGAERTRWLGARELAAPRLAVMAAPIVAGTVLLKLVLELTDVHPLELNPLLSGLVAATVFLLGFLLAGTLADYKESERLPGEIAASLDSIADEALTIHAEQGTPEAAACVDHLIRIAYTIRGWLFHKQPVEDVFALIRGLNAYYMVFAPAIQAGFTTRLKGEQNAIRKTVIRIDAIRTTSFVTAGYAIAKLTGALLVIGLMLTDLGSSVGESLFFVGVITLLLTYVYLLIRDLDDPFRYERGAEGAADVSLLPLGQLVARLEAERDALGIAPVTVTQAPPVSTPS
jgi:hypothetical protein